MSMTYKALDELLDIIVTADNDISTKLAAEATTRETSDNEISAELAAKVSEINESIANLSGSTSHDIADLNARLDAETQNRANADNKLIEDLNAETVTREAADQQLQNNINTVQSNLNNEASTRAEADTGLDNKITNLNNSFNAYKEANDNAVKKVADDLAEESSRATSAESALDERVQDLEAAIGEGGSVAAQITDRINSLDADITSTIVEEGKGLTVQVVETDGKITNVVVNGNYNNTYDLLGSAKVVDDKLTSYKTSNDAAVKKVVDDLSTAESGLSNRIKAVEDDYLTSTDKTELTSKITTNANNISSLNSSINAINNESTGILATAKNYADSLDRAMDARVDVLEAAVGEGGSVETQITNKINQLDSTVKSANVEAGKGLQVEAVETDGKLTSVSLTGNYDNTYDKLGAATSAANTAESNANAKLDAYKTSNDAAMKKVSDNLTSEVSRATGAESGLSTRIKTIEDDYLKAADKTNLQNQITSNTNAISVLNGTGAGSVSKQVSDAVAALVSEAPEAYDTLKEISD